jgi:outer membrane protein insertion porin family
VGDRERQEGLLRAHQHPRQLQDPRQGDPPRDEDRRGRAVLGVEPRESKRRINALGFFEEVDVSTGKGSSDELVEVNVEVSERPTGTFQIGAGFSSVENFIAQAQISQNNLFGRGQTLALQAQLSSLRQQFLLRFVEPYFLDTNWTFAFDLYNQSRAFNNFSRNAGGFSLTWGYPLSYEPTAY